MNRNYVGGVVIFVMKYFFDIEREITQQLWISAYTKVLAFKTILSGVHQVITLHKP
jgi:hypothetical protein